jgi:FG-GAP-like repeat/FG-GAP repeat/Peptidase M66
MSGSSGRTVTTTVARNTNANLSAEDQDNVSSLLTGRAWTGSGPITYSFPTSSSFYGTEDSYGSPHPFNGFGVLTAQQQADAVRAFNLIQSYTNATFTQITETSTATATIRLANSSWPSTAYGFFPATTPAGGDAFFGGTGQNPVMGNFDSGGAILHEIGHTLGLKHGQEDTKYGAMNADRLDIEFSLMNYPSYIGATESFSTTNASPQTYMMYDIAALQYLYGANFSNAGQSLTYTWSATTGAMSINNVSQGTPATNNIFSTIWTAGATSTYDLSNYNGNQVDDMTPGGWMLFSQSQLALLNAGATSRPTDIFARGDIFNALLSNGDKRSLINNLIVGDGDNTVTGNDADNTITLGTGSSTVDGGLGHNTTVLKWTSAQATLTNNFDGSWRLTGPGSATDTLRNTQIAQFTDGRTRLTPAAGDLFGNGYAGILLNNGQQVAAWNMTGTTISAGSGVVNALGSGWRVVRNDDFNNDGKSDLLLQNGRQLAAWLMNGTAIQAGSGPIGTLATGWRVAGTGDFNRDGYADILLQNGQSLAEWQMNGTTIIGGGTIGTALAAGWGIAGVGDFNGDGFSDILLRNGQSLAEWQMNGTTVIGGGVIGMLGAGWSVAGVSDFNNDGRADILLQNGSQLAVWLMNGTAVSSSGVIGTLASGWSVANTGDYNGDSRSDILLQNGSQLAMWMMNGTQLLSDSGGIASPLGAGWVSTSAGDKSTSDFNGDGYSDILLQNGQQLAEWQMNGTSTIASGVIDTLATDWSVVGTGDFNGDARADLLLQNGLQVAEWQLSGTTVIASVSAGTLAAGYSILGVQDFNNDGRDDILLQKGEQLAMWQMNGASVIASNTVGTLAPGWSVAGVGDFHGPGHGDILLQNGQQLALWDMSGSTIISNDTVGTQLAAGWSVAGIGDFNGDGYSDILLRSGQQLAEWQMNGASIVGSGVIGTLAAGWNVASIGDYNSDGRGDLLLQNGHQLAEWQLNGTQILTSSGSLQSTLVPGWNLWLPGVGPGAG